MYDHYSTLKGIEQMLGLTTLLGHAGDAGKQLDQERFSLRRLILMAACPDPSGTTEYGLPLTHPG